MVTTGLVVLLILSLLGKEDERKLSRQYRVLTPAMTPCLHTQVKQPDFGGISHLQLRADFSGDSTMWHLSRVEMMHLVDNSTYLLTYNSYLNSWSTTAYLYPQSTYTVKVIILLIR